MMDKAILTCALTGMRRAGLEDTFYLPGLRD